MAEGDATWGNGRGGEKGGRDYKDRRGNSCPLAVKRPSYQWLEGTSGAHRHVGGSGRGKIQTISGSGPAPPRDIENDPVTPRPTLS